LRAQGLARDAGGGALLDHRDPLRLRGALDAEDLLMSQEAAVIGVGRSGAAAARLLRASGAAVYASDSGKGERLEALAARLRGDGVDVQLGGHDLDRIAKASVVVVSPGVPPEAPPLRAAREAGVPV